MNDVKHFIVWNSNILYCVLFYICALIFDYFLDNMLVKVER